MELCYSRALLFDFGKGCPYHGKKATGKTGGGEDILFVLNNELTEKDLANVQFTF